MLCQTRFEPHVRMAERNGDRASYLVTRAAWQARR